MTSTIPSSLVPLLLLPAVAAGADKITFDDHAFPVFEQSCLNCHNPDKAKGGLDLSTFNSAIKGGSGGKIVEPGDPGSKLIAVVMQTSEPRMPPEGDKLSNDKIDLLRKWVDGGLLENKSSGARKPDQPKFDVAMGGNPTAKPEGPPPMPAHLLLEPLVAAPSGTAVRGLAASPWAPLLAVTSQQQVLLYDTDHLRLAAVLPFPAGDPVSLAFTPDGRYLIAGGGIGGKSGTTVTWDVTNGKIMLQAGREFDSVLAGDIRPDFAAVATGGPSRLLKIWNTTDGEPIASIKKHTDWITALDISPDGVLLATGDRNGGVWVWESQTGTEFHTLRAHQARITGLAFRADSNVLATASEDGTVRFWEMNGGSEIKKIDAHEDGVLGFCWARDGSFATIGRDQRVKTWKPDFNLLREIAHESALPTAVALSADGKMVFVGDYNGQVTAYDASDGTRLGNMPSNPPTIAGRLATLHEQIHTDIKQEEKFWQAADLNARAIHKRAEAADLAARFDTLAAEFSATATLVEQRRSALNETARRRQSFISALAANPSDPALAAELASVIDTLSFRLDQRRADLTQSTRALLALRNRIDQSTPPRITATTEASNLRAQYQSLQQP